MKKISLMFTLTALFSFLCLESSATHFRYGTVNYEIVSQTGSGASKQTVVKFTFNQAWRAGIYGSSTPAIGSVISTAAWIFGDGQSTSIDLTVTAVQVEPNSYDNWFIGNFVVNHTYIGDLDRLAYFSSSARIGTLQGGNANDSYRNETLVTLSENFNDSPVSSLPAIVNVPIGLASYNLNLNAFDPNGDALTYALSTTSQSLLSPNNPNIYNSINAATGVVSLNTTGKAVGQLWALQFMITDSKGATTPIDFIIRIVGATNPPQFVAPSPIAGATFKVLPNVPVNFTMQASDADVADLVSLLGSGIPGGATFPNPPAANPVMSNFSWTPGIADLGVHVVTFAATDNNGAQTLRTINIVVSLAPVFDVPPTPAVGAHSVVLPGNNISFTVQATDPDPLDVCQITAATGKDYNTNLPIPIYAGVTLNPTLPTTSGNTTSTLVSWTPTSAQWGHKHMIFTATDAYNDQTTHEVSILVNTPPVFQSAAPTAACVGQLFTYNVVSTDADIPAGDVIDLLELSMPSWLSFTDNGDGTGTLSGTPSAGDVGLLNMSIEAQDMHHHVNGTAIQNLGITVSNCGGNPPVCQFTNSFSDIWINNAYKAAGASDPHTYYWGLSYGAIAARPKNGVGPYTYQWSSSEGYAIKDDTQKRARLWYPTGPQWVKVEITDVGASCTTTDSIYIDWVDFTCNQPSIWYYELCNVNTNTTSCVQGTVNMRNLVSTGDYVYGPCGNPKTNWGNQSSLFEVNLFPNPSNGQFSYELVSATANNYSISIMDINGRVLYSENVDNDYNHVMKDLDLSHLSAGVYIFQVSDENNSAVKRFVIQ